MTWTTLFRCIASSWPPELVNRGRSGRHRRTGGPPQLGSARCGIGEGEQQLSGGAHRKRQRLSDLREVTELVAPFHGRDANTGIALSNVQVHAFADRVAEAHHGRLRDPDDVTRPTGRLPPARQAGTRDVRRGANPEEQP